jgi:putative Mn2+ efflux pump MntP
VVLSGIPAARVAVVAVVQAAAVAVRAAVVGVAARVVRVGVVVRAVLAGVVVMAAAVVGATTRRSRSVRGRSSSRT